MEARPKISRYLIIVVIALFGFMAICLYSILASEKITKFAIDSAINNFVPADKLGLKMTGVEGCMLDGVRVKKIEIKHVKPNFEIIVTDLSLNVSYSAILDNGKILIDGGIDCFDLTGQLKLPETVASVPAFIGPVCMAALPGNIRIKDFYINNVILKPDTEKSLVIKSDRINIKSEQSSEKLKVDTLVNVDWKNKNFAVANFDGTYDSKKNKLNGNLEIKAAKQMITSDITVANGKRGIEFIGNIASQTVLDIQPLSQWLGYMWQSEYPYGISGKVLCRGSWLYNKENGFIANLSGSYEKIEATFLGLFVTIFEMNGNWKLFNDTLSLSDSGSKLLGQPISINGNIEAVTAKSRKFDLNLDYNSVNLDKLLGYIPWMVKYTNNIPELSGVATVTVKLHGNRPMINSRIEFYDLQQVGLKPVTKVNGKVFYLLSETGNGNINGNFTAATAGALPIFFKRFSDNLYANENVKNAPATYTFSLQGSFDEKIKLKGKMLCGQGVEVFETSGDLINNRFFVNAFTKENRAYYLNGADPIDLILMR